MKTKHLSQRVRLWGWLLLCCWIGIWGCSPRKATETANNEPKLEAQQPATGEKGPAEPDSTIGTPQEQAPLEPLAGSSSGSENIESPVVPAEPAMPAEPPQTWTVQRIIALAATGPILIDLSANIDGKSLDEAAQAATSRAAAHIEKDLEKPWTWPKLLDHPLIRSGWLGNLPEGDQRDQVISMYNKDGDDEVDDDELAAFLTRGLARGAAFRFTDIGSAPGSVVSRSPWEQLDVNQDSSLDKSEIEKLADIVARFDLNADRVVTVAEMQAGRGTVSTGTMSMASMLDSKTAIFVGADQKPKQTANKLIEHYTALREVPRDLWSGWTDEQWKAIDTDGDMLITCEELQQIATAPPELELKVQFKALEASGISIAAKVNSSSDFSWASGIKTAGQARGSSGAIAVVVTDSYTDGNRAVLRTQLTAALANPQLATFFRSQLQLGESAFDVLDADNNDKLSDEEFENAWQWLTSIRGSRLLARWMLAESAWFRMADMNADNRLTEIERQKFKGYLTELDKDKDGIVSPIEIPMAIRLEIARSDDRLQQNLPPTTGGQIEPVGWFAASDTNNDSVVNSAEFLGTLEDFRAYDTDNDGFISATEAYQNPTGELQ